ncbi:MAG: DUF3854 domain-containing protein [Acidithiobacillus sp.]|nr:DUF3854 domain-containing protein [Acidithiobacillus sp.]
MLVITEGEKKAEKACKSGVPCVAIPGVDMWRDVGSLAEQAAALVSQGGYTEADAIAEIKRQRKIPIAPDLITVLQWCITQRKNVAVAIVFDGDGASFDKELTKKVLDGKTAVTIKEDSERQPEVWEHEDTGDFHTVINSSVRRAGWFFGECLRKQLHNHTGTKTPVQVLFCPLDVQSSKDAVEITPLSLDDWIIKDGGPGVLFSINKQLRKARKIARLAAEKDTLSAGHPFFGCSIDPDLIPDEFNKNTKLSPDSIVERLVDGEVVGKAIDVSSELLIWTGGCWEIMPTAAAEIAVQSALSTLMPSKNTSHVAQSCLRTLMRSPYVYQVPAPKKLPNDRVQYPLQDAIIITSGDKIEEVISPPDKSWGLRHCIPVRLEDLGKPTPLFDKFLDEILPDKEVQAAVLEFIAYTLFPDTRYNKGHVWIGSGSNGKSALASIVEKLHSKPVALDLRDLSSGFANEQIIGASLVTIDEAPNRFDEQTLKNAISGGGLNVNRKFKPALTYFPTAKFLIRANDMPAVTDQSFGFWRRFSFVRFEKTISEADQNPNLINEIVEKELGGIVEKLLVCTQLLLKRGRLMPEPEAMQLVKSQLRKETNSVIAWASDIELRIETDTHRMPAMKTAYAVYRDWCRENTYMPVSAHKFWARLKNVDGLKDLQTHLQPRIGKHRPKVASVQSDLEPITSAAKEIASESESTGSLIKL